MANIKFSQLSAVLTLSGADIFPVVQGGTSKRTSVTTLGAQVIRTLSGRVTTNSGLLNTKPIALTRLSGTGTWTIPSAVVLSGAGGIALNTKVGFYGKTPIVQPLAVASATTNSGVITQFNTLLTRLRNIGIIAT